MRKPLENAGLLRRLAACCYELLLLIAIWLVTTALFTVLLGNADHTFNRLLLQLFLWLVTGVYFVVCWHRSGQTLAAQTWKIKLVNQQGLNVSLKQSILRYLLVTVSVSLLGIGFIWALIDPARLFLHDRILRTRLIKLGKLKK